MVLVKNVKFLHPFFLGKIGVEKVFGAILDRKEAILDYQASYIGETGWNLSTRLTEHKRTTRNCDINNHIAEHNLKTKHQIEWDSATCITYSTDY